MRNLHVTDLTQKDDYMIAKIAPDVTIVHDSSDNTITMNINDRRYKIDNERENLQDIGTILMKYQSIDGDKRVFTRAIPHLQKFASDNKLELIKG